MSRFRSPEGIVVSVDDEVDGLLSGLYYKKIGGRSAAKHTEPTPSGSIRRPVAEDTQTGQIRKQQAQDPFQGR